MIESEAERPKAVPRPRARAAARLTAGYLVLTAALVLLGGTEPARLGLLAAHAALAAAVLALDRARAAGGPRALRVLADWLPLLLAPAFYWELPLLMEALPGPVRYHDPLIAGLEAAVFGGQPAYQWAGAWPSALFSELVHACYVSFYPLIYLPPLLLYVGVSGGRTTHATRAGAFDDTLLALLLCFFLCFLIFVVFPVQGPRYLGVPQGVPDGPVRGLVLAILESGSSRGAAFPSSHVAVVVTQALLALRHQPRVGRWMLALAVGLGAGSVYGGFHYAVDAIGGAALGALVVPAARRLGSGA